MRCCLLLIALLFSLNAPAQPAEDVVLQQNGKHVSYRFTLKQGNICSGIDLLRSTDGVNFSVAAFVDAVCGSATTDEFYSFNDTNPTYNETNYYRLDLHNLGLTDVESIFVYKIPETGLLIYPLPGDKVSVVMPFEADGKVTAQLYDATGSIIIQWESITGYSFTIPAGLFPGSYVIRVRRPDGFRLAAKVMIR